MFGTFSSLVPHLSMFHWLQPAALPRFTAWEAGHGGARLVRM